MLPKYKHSNTPTKINMIFQYDVLVAPIFANQHYHKNLQVTSTLSKTHVICISSE